MEEPVTLGFEPFWSWLLAHPNCIVRAGTPEAVLYDHEDLHWHLASESHGTLVVQVIRGKSLQGELLLEPDSITYVQGSVDEYEKEYVFELISEAEGERTPLYYFVLSHPYEQDEESASPVRVH